MNYKVITITILLCIFLPVVTRAMYELSPAFKKFVKVIEQAKISHDLNAVLQAQDELAPHMSSPEVDERQKTALLINELCDDPVFRAFQGWIPVDHDLSPFTPHLLLKIYAARIQAGNSPQRAAKFVKEITLYQALYNVRKEYGELWSLIGNGESQNLVPQKYLTNPNDLSQTEMAELERSWQEKNLTQDQIKRLTLDIKRIKLELVLEEL